MTTARLWKLLAKRYRFLVNYRWDETCVALKTAAITAERDALRRRVAELEAREQPDCCDDPASRLRPGLHVRPTSVPEGRMR